MFYRTLTAGAVLLLTSGCATRGDEVDKAWQIEPVFNVQHAFRSTQAYYGLGRYHDGSQAWRKAVDAYRKAIAADGQNIEAYNALGVALARLGHHADAETTLRQAVALAPALAHVRSNLGYVLLLAGKPQDAATELQAAVRQDRGDTTAAANLREAQVQVQALAWKAEAGAVVHAAAPPAQPAPVSLAGPIGAVPLAPMASLPMHVAAAPVGDAGTPSARHVSGRVTQAPEPAMPSPAAGDKAMSVAALRVFDQPNVASLQAPAPNQAGSTQTQATVLAAATAAVAPEAGAAVVRLRAFEQAATTAAVVRPVEGVAHAVAVRAWDAQVVVAVGASGARLAPAAAGRTLSAVKEPIAARVATNESVVPSAMAPARGTAAAVDAAPVARLEVSNGNGITGMAASVRLWLVQHGVSAARLTNQLPYTQQQTVVQYRSGYELAAQHVARTLPTSARLEVARDMQSDVRVVLGRDWLQYADCLAHQSCQEKGPSVALASN